MFCITIDVVTSGHPLLTHVKTEWIGCLSIGIAIRNVFWKHVCQNIGGENFILDRVMSNIALDELKICQEESYLLTLFGCQSVASKIWKLALAG